MIFGASYESAAIVPDRTPPPRYANPVTDYTPSGRPGGRAPHAWLTRGGARVSTIDLVGKRFALRASGAAWRADGAWHTTYGLEAGSAMLVRPDGYVAWRGRGAEPEPAASLPSAMASILGRA